MVDSTAESESKKPMEKLTQKNATVQMKNAELAYNSFVINTECFLLNGRYYFKLADFAAASDNALEREKVGIEISANSGIVDEPNKQSFDGVSVQWNNDTKVIDVKRTTTDLLKIFNDIRANSGNPVPTKPSTNDMEFDTGTNMDKTIIYESETIPSQHSTVKEYFTNFQIQSPLTSAPQEGEVLADILIDDSVDVYLDNAMTKVNYNNLTKPYRWIGSFGECTWYAEARFIETVGSFVAENPYSNSVVSGWVENAKSDKCPDLDGITDPYAIQPRSIGVYKGHALFIEWVDYDADGKPVTVYFTEANNGHDGRYRPEQDAKVKVLPFDEFIQRQPFIGYVVAK